MCKLLIIDDNPMEHLILESVLLQNGLFPGQSFSLDAKAMLGYLATNCDNSGNLPDLIFLDLNMPDFDGFDFIRDFEALVPKLHKAIDIYIVSSSVNKSDIEKSKNYPFVKDYFVKPIQRDTLVSLYEKYKKNN